MHVIYQFIHHKSCTMSFVALNERITLMMSLGIILRQLGLWSLNIYIKKPAIKTGGKDLTTDMYLTNETKDSVVLGSSGFG